MRKFLVAVAALATVVTSLALASPATAVAPRVSITLSAYSVTVGKNVTVKAAVRRGAPKQKATLQRKHGTKWTRVSTKYLPRTGSTKKIAFTQRLNARGSYTFRVVLAAKGKYASARSRTVTVRVIPTPTKATTPTNPTPTNPTPTATPLKFNLTGAKGLAMRQTNATTARVAARTASVATSTPHRCRT